MKVPLKMCRVLRLAALRTSKLPFSRKDGQLSLANLQFSQRSVLLSDFRSVDRNCAHSSILGSSALATHGMRNRDFFKSGIAAIEKYLYETGGWGMEL